jgi:hypothetical protein
MDDAEIDKIIEEDEKSSLQIAKLNEQQEKLIVFCGVILRICISVESLLEYKTLNYFHPDNDSREILQNIINRMSFGRKIGLLEEICKHEKLYDDFGKLFTSLRLICKTRNDIAHNPTFVADPMNPDIKLRPKGNLFTEKDLITINENTVETVRKNVSSVYMDLLKLSKAIEKKRNEQK